MAILSKEKLKGKNGEVFIDKNMKYKICDAHNDFLTELPVCEIGKYAEQSRRSHVQTICASYWTTKKDENVILQEIEARFHALQSATDKFLLHIEDLWWVKDENTLKKLIRLKPFSCSLTWNEQNLLAGGTNFNCGLTQWGQFCLLKLKQSGIVVDTAHLSRASFDDVTRLLPGNIYCSHTGFYGVKRRKRNLTDGQIDKIVRSNGFVGLFFFDKCVQVGKNFSAKDVVFNLNYFTSRWGFDNIGLGTDFFGIENYPQGLEDYAQLQNLADLLIKHGYTQKQIHKIFHRNFENFVERIKDTN